MRALLIEFDLRTGKRAGDINPKDPHLPCHGWQDLKSEPAKEIRLVEDDRDLSLLKGVKGVTILEGKEAINKAILKHIPTQYGIKDRDILIAHLQEQHISLDMLAHRDLADNALAKQLWEMGLAGIIKREPRLI